VRCVDIDAGRNAAVAAEIAKAGGTAEVVTDRHHRWLARGAAAGPADPPLRAFGIASAAQTDTALAVTEQPGTAWSTPMCAQASSSPASSGGA
jgi:hypothetical protein